uniref:Uncharacterized protein n=1 Tax=viral metagenome TaxID=1070528 RepID=A0A6C0C6T7_9ZZZZ
MDTDQYQFYKNAGFRNTRNEKKTLVIDIDDADGETHLGSGTQFSVDLFEPLRIDKHSEVYLDNFITLNSNIANSGLSLAYCLKINEFNIDSNAASTNQDNMGAMYNSIIIPNEHTTVSDNHAGVLHKSKKFNYVCDINPGKIGRISGTITNLDGTPIFHGDRIGNIHTYALTGIDSFSTGTAFPITGNELFTISATGNVLTGITTQPTCQMLASHQDDTKTLHFSYDGEITLHTGSESIVFTDVDNDTIVISTASGDNPNLQLVKNPGRFIAEFLIISKE